MAHEEQNDPVAQSSMYQRRPPKLAPSTADLSERDIKENLVVKEEETNDTFFFLISLIRTEGCVARLRSLPMRDRARAMRPARYVGPAGKERFGAFVWFGLVRVGLRWVSGWDFGWDCARGIFPPRECSPGPP